MSQPNLTRRQVSAIAKLDFSGLSHAQRLEAIARAVGYESAGAFMSVLGAAEKAGRKASAKTKAPGGEPARLVVAFGTTCVSRFSSNESLFDEYGTIDGNVEELSFDTPAERDAYLQGLQDADGWMDHMVLLDSVDEPGHAYLRALEKDPSLSFPLWHQEMLEMEYGGEEGADGSGDDAFTEEGAGGKGAPDSPPMLTRSEMREIRDYERERDRITSEKHPGRAARPILGWQVSDPETGEHWNDRPSFEILDRDTSLLDLREAHAAGATRFRLIAIREGDIEDPGFA